MQYTSIGVDVKILYAYMYRTRYITDDRKYNEEERRSQDVKIQRKKIHHCKD